MFGFFIFNTIRALTTEVTAAKAARFVSRSLPSNRFTRYAKDMAYLWLNQETNLDPCKDCYEKIIEEGNPDICSDCKNVRENDLAEEQAELEAFIERMHEEDAAYNASVESDEEIARIRAELGEYDDDDEPCPGRCGTSIRHCICHETDPRSSFAYQAGWTP